MFFRNKARRRPTTTPVAAQTLESRALLSATVSVSNKMLTINGTAGQDRVVLDTVGSSTRVWANGQTFWFATSQFNSIAVNMGAGNDYLSIKPYNSTFDRVSINMGTGSGEGLDIQANLIKTLIVDSRLTTTNATVYHTAVTTMQADFGDGSDKLYLANGTVVDRINLNMGRGNDTLSAAGYSGVRSGQINMGDGDDTVNQARSSRFNTTIYGGSGYDYFGGYRSDSGASLNSFERIIWR